jgi:ribokinase
MNQQNILVIGSLNTDMVVRTEKIPVPGETVLGKDFFMNTGGKGANQAVAASRLGGNVSFIGKIGNDIFGERCLQSLKEEGIETSFVEIDDNIPSGIAIIAVDKQGENSIVVAPGSNYKLSTDDIEKASALFDTNEFILIQLEIPMQTIEHIVNKGSKLEKKIILNPAPASVLNEELMSKLYIITPNETEAEILTGIKINDIETTKEAASCLLGKGVKNVIITLGDKGALVMTDKICEIVPTPKVDVVDTTAAGDTFNGALAVALTEGKDILNATNFACRAAAISVTRIGAQISMPCRTEVQEQ